jgi:hypothetical protein
VRAGCKQTDDDNQEGRMADTPNPDITGAQWVRALAQGRGLDRAYALFPEAVAAAVARGTATMSPLPAAFSPVTEPAAVFDPAKFAGQPDPGRDRKPGAPA